MLFSLTLWFLEALLIGASVGVGEENGKKGHEQTTLYSSLPDEPIQLVRPDPLEHRKLEIIHSNVKYLHQVNSAVAVIAVVGKFHSGKSFLLNQLMGKQQGFGIGPSVKPQTMGIWMWGKPMTVNSSSGELAMIFLDTEGFAASNISESYDAKIFSVATLLSSYLIYNSVKIIDQGDIDYLELLSRRTQLFALRSQMTRSQWFQQFNHDLLRFPPLIWVVQDFVQSTEEGESARQWLHRIMESNSRESTDYDIKLLGIFDSVDCHTLFLPATKRTLLQDLSQATEEDLTSEYKEERDDLLKVLMNGLVPKEKNGKPISGPELAMLLEILVTAANEGSLVEIPGRWASFVKEHKVSALEDCVMYYESDMKLLDALHENDAINETELEVWHSSSLQKAEHLLQQLLFGLDDALIESTEELNKIAMEKYEKIVDLNEKKIQLKCSEVQRKLEIKTEEGLQSLVFPIKSVELLAIQTNVTEKRQHEYFSLVHHLSSNPAYDRYYQQLEVGIQHIFDGVKLKNNAAFGELLEKAIAMSIKIFRASCANQNQIPRTTSKLNTIIDAAAKDARKEFEVTSQTCRDESVFEPYRSSMEVKLLDEIAKCKNENSNLVKEACESAASELMNQFRHNTGSSKIHLPIKDEDLNVRLQSEKEAVYLDYHRLMGHFDDIPGFRDVKVYLDEGIAKICAQRRDENYHAYMKEVKIPLNTAKKLILLAADNYDTEYSILQYMMQVCMVNLDEGKAKDWEESLKLKITQKYIQDSPELQRIIISKQGWWSTIKGFFQWLLSFVV